jgi:hypothetical protein
MTQLINTLKAAEALQKAGLTKTVSKAIIEVMTSTTDAVATKADVEGLSIQLGSKIDALNVRLAGVEKRQDATATHADLANVRSDLIKWMVGLIMAQTAIIVTLVQLWP